MKIEYFKEYSHCLNRDMEFKVYGHMGIPCLVFPAQDGRFYDFENLNNKKRRHKGIPPLVSSFSMSVNPTFH